MSTRRAALRTLLFGALSACGATAARLKGKRLVQVATIDKLPDDSALRTQVEGHPIIVVNDGGKVRTFIGLCTHEGCPLGWNPNQHLIRCPCHGSAFNTSGLVVNGPAKAPLTELDTYVERGTVLVVPPVQQTALFRS